MRVLIVSIGIAVIGLFAAVLGFPKALLLAHGNVEEGVVIGSNSQHSFLGQSRRGYTYQTVPVSRGLVRREVHTTGIVTPQITVLVGSEISGKVKYVHVDFNDKVKAGQLLAELDSKSFATQVKQARADLNVAKAELRQHLASMRKAKAVLETAKQSYDRQKSLSAKSLATFEKLGATRRDWKVAEGEIDLIHANIASAKAKIAQRIAQVEQTEIELDRTRIRSPIDGTIMLRQAHIGQTVAASLKAPELFSISGDLRNMIIEAQVNETDIGMVRKGQSVKFTVDAHPNDRFAGKVKQIRLSPVVEKTVVTYVVTVLARNDDLKLLPGMTANLVVETGTRQNAIRLPIEALHFRLPKKAARQTAEHPQDINEQLGKLISEAQSKLGLDEQQYQLVRTRLRERLSSNPKLFKPSEHHWKRLLAVVEPALTSRQRAELERWKRSRMEQRRRSQTVWLMSGSGLPRRQLITVGLGGTKFVEVVSGQINESAQVIVRSRRPKRK